MAIEKHSYVFRADAGGIVADMGIHVNGVLLAVASQPQSPAPEARFAVELLLEGEDLLATTGRQRSPTERQRWIIRMVGLDDVHPLVGGDERLTWRISGLTPGARVRIDLFVGSDEGVVS